MRAGQDIRAAGFRFFSSPVDAPRARRATDLLLAVGALAGLVLVGWIHRPPTSFEKALIDLLATFPELLDAVWQLLYDLLLLWPALLVAVTVARRRTALVRDQVLAVVMALVAGCVAGRLVEGSWPVVWRGLRDGGRCRVASA